MLSSLPVELLLEIFKGLDYTTLKVSLSVVCRLFRAIIAKESRRPTGPLAELLFVDKLITSAERQFDIAAAPGLPTFELHPCFNLLRISNEPINNDTLPEFNVHCLGFYMKNGNFLPITRTSIARQHATSPASDYIELRVQVPKEIMQGKCTFTLNVSRTIDKTAVGKPKPITVSEVAEGLCRMLRRSLAKPLQEPVDPRGIYESRISEGVVIDTQVKMLFEVERAFYFPNVTFKPVVKKQVAGPSPENESAGGHEDSGLIERLITGLREEDA